MKAIFLGTQSFKDTYGKVGIQYIAEGLVENGWSVDYVSNASSPLDVFSGIRRRRFKRAWMNRLDAKGFCVQKGLMEYPLRAPFPARKDFLRFNWQRKFYSVFLPPHIRNTHYDLCIHDASSTFLFLPQLKARRLVYRLNDLPSGFSYAYHKNFIDDFDRMVKNGRYDDIWAVSTPLAEYATSLNSANKVIVIPNGVSIEDLAVKDATKKQPKSAVFVGNILPWVDIGLIDKVARCLPEWVFDFYGPLLTDWVCTAPNVRYRGVVERDKLKDVLSRYLVGLIPLRDISDRIRTVERPLKFYSYILIGLGVAATDIGALRSGMGKWAAYGNTPEEFSHAVVEAAHTASSRPVTDRENFAEEHSWDNVIKKIMGRLNAVMK